MQKVSTKVNRRDTIAIKEGFWVNLRLIRDRYMSQMKSDMASLRESRVEAELLATEVASRTAPPIDFNAISWAEASESAKHKNAKGISTSATTIWGGY